MAITDGELQTILSVNPWVIHRNPEIFGEDCDSFNPDRWLQTETAQMNAFLIHVCIRFLLLLPWQVFLMTIRLPQWGAGYNACPGRNFAQFEISKLAATLLRDYDIEQIDPKQEWTWKNHFICVPYDWPCRIRHRSR